MHTFITKLTTAAILLSTSAAALASTAPPNRIPEPGILELAAVAAVVGWIAHKRRK